MDRNDLHSSGRKGACPNEVLLALTGPGSMRQKVYDTCARRTRKHARLPHDVLAIYEQFLVKLRSVVCETMQRQEKVEKTFGAEEMGRHSHSIFTADREYVPEDLEDAGVFEFSQNMLYRRCLH